MGNWWADNGVWEVGAPDSTVGPGAAYQGNQCAATVLSGSYPSGADSRLISPHIALPGNLQPGEKIMLWFQNWFSLGSGYNNVDNGFVVISVNNGPWETLTDGIDEDGAIWSQFAVDLTAYADSTVRIGFRILDRTGYGATTSSGWYIDNITIKVGNFPYNNPEGWENGIGYWWADRGVWEAGAPTSGPDSAYSGQCCAATVLDGNYPYGANSRLISPTVTLTPLPSQYPGLFFWHWFSFGSGYSSPDIGYVQISVDGGDWQTISNDYSGTSSIYSQVYIDLSAYADSTVRIAFRVLDRTGYGATTTSGWYIDDIRIEGIELSPCEYKPSPAVPKDFILYPACPNPFNPTTRLTYDLPKPGNVSLRIFDITGGESAIILDGFQSTGRHQVVWNAESMPSGLYFARLTAGGESSVVKMLLVK